MAAGLVLIDKPQGWTSHDIVAKLRGIAGTRRVGHAGTLDPMATGLLLLGIDNGTKLLTYLVGASKTYEATIRLGADTITDDAEGDIVSYCDPNDLLEVLEPQLEAALQKLRGEIMQVPSSVSAIKVNGERAYARVRGGEEVKLAARPITVSKFEMVSTPRGVQEGDNLFLDVDVIVECSSGTYIRALARDLGKDLCVGGHLKALRRTRVGNYRVEDAQSMDSLNRETLKILPLADAARAEFAVHELSIQEETDIRHGKRIAAGILGPGTYAAINQSDSLVAMLEVVGNQLKSSVVFAEEDKNV